MHKRLITNFEFNIIINATNGADITKLPNSTWHILGSPNGSPLRSGTTCLPSPIRGGTIDLGVARVNIGGHFYKVLLDWNDESGGTICSLYRGEIIQPIKVDIILGNDERWIGYYWIQESTKDMSFVNSNTRRVLESTYQSFLFKEWITEHGSFNLPVNTEDIVSLPAPSAGNWGLANAQYNIRTGLNDERVSICYRDDVKYIWAQAQARDLFNSALYSRS